MKRRLETPVRSGQGQQRAEVAAVRSSQPVSTSILALLELQRTAGNRAVHSHLLAVQRAETSYTSAVGKLAGTTLLKMVSEMTRVTHPLLTGHRAWGPPEIKKQVDSAVAAHVEEWGALIREKFKPQFIGAQEPTAPRMGTTRSGLDVNAAFWLTIGEQAPPSYRQLADRIAKEQVAVSQLRQWMQAKSSSGSQLLALLGEATFGAEPARNPRAFATALMMLDLFETHEAPREKPEGKIGSMSELYHFVDQSGQVTGGLPMMGQDTYSQGRAGLPEEDEDLNAVQRKEAIAVSAWLRRMQANRDPFTEAEVRALMVRRMSTFETMQPKEASQEALAPLTAITANIAQILKDMDKRDSAIELDELQNATLRKMKERRATDRRQINRLKARLDEATTDDAKRRLQLALETAQAEAESHQIEYDEYQAKVSPQPTAVRPREAEPDDAPDAKRRQIEPATAEAAPVAPTPDVTKTAGSSRDAA